MNAVALAQLIGQTNFKGCKFVRHASETEASYLQPLSKSMENSLDKRTAAASLPSNYRSR